MTFTSTFAIAGLLGLAVGSFLNVVIHRVPRGESVIAPRSHCPVCTVALRPWHTVPVLSWVAQRGRCAGRCEQPAGPAAPANSRGSNRDP